jgi:hypothetical protein
MVMHWWDICILEPSTREGKRQLQQSEQLGFTQ